MPDVVPVGKILEIAERLSKDGGGVIAGLAAVCLTKHAEPRVTDEMVEAVCRMAINYGASRQVVAPFGLIEDAMRRALEKACGG